MTREVRLCAIQTLEGLTSDQPISNYTRRFYLLILMACVTYPVDRLARVLFEINAEYDGNQLVAKEVNFDFLHSYQRLMVFLTPMLHKQNDNFETIQMREFPSGNTNIERWVGRQNPKPAHLSFSSSMDTAILTLLAERVK